MIVHFQDMIYSRSLNKTALTPLFSRVWWSSAPLFTITTTTAANKITHQTISAVRQFTLLNGKSFWIKQATEKMWFSWKLPSGRQADRQAMQFFPLTVMIAIYFPFAWPYQCIYVLSHRMRNLHIFQINQMTINHKLSQDIYKKKKINRREHAQQRKQQQQQKRLTKQVCAICSSFCCWPVIEIKWVQGWVCSARNKRPHVGKHDDEEHEKKRNLFWIFVAFDCSRTKS